MPGPQVCVGGCLRVTARGMGVGGRFPGRRGRRPLRVAREWAAAEACPSSGPAGPPSPKGEGKGCSGGIHPSRGVGGGGRSRRGGAPRPTDGDIKMLWGLRGQPFPGRRAVGAGHCGVVSVGPRLSGAKPGSEQCLPPRGKQPHERASFAGWRRSLCAAKRPARGLA